MYEAWIHWNPDRFLFTIPYLDRPVGWYGLCFALGFAVSYAVGVRVLFQKFLEFSPFTQQYIEDWGKVLEKLKEAPSLPNQHPLIKVFSYFPPKLQDKILSAKKEKDFQEKEKKQIIEVFEQIKNDRSFYEEDFPNYMTLSPETKKMIAKGKKDPDFSPTGRNFLLLQDLFNGGVISFKTLVYALGDRALWMQVLGTAIGARLGHVFFYNWSYYQDHLAEIPRIWDGGLASHGGIFGVIVAWLIFYLSIRKNYPWFKLIHLLDVGAIATGFTLGSIRIGNFFNQEIIGRPSDVPWAIVFENPAEEDVIVPRHPVQIYESLCYYILFFILYFLWHKKGSKLRPGMAFGFANCFMFSGRFFLEYFKVPQSEWLDRTSFIMMGQFLSVPFIFMGIYFLLRPRLLQKKIDSSK